MRPRINPQRLARLAAIQARYESRLMELPQAVGVGIGYRQRGGRKTDELCLVVMVSKKLARAALSPADLAPRELEGVGVDVVETGVFLV